MTALDEVQVKDGVDQETVDAVQTFLFFEQRVEQCIGVFDFDHLDTEPRGDRHIDLVQVVFL